ncbi:MAG: hypothetical protein V4714_16460 [Bacteroidota bacterium]
MKKYLVFLALVFVAHLSVQAQHGLVGKPASAFTLEDQFDKKITVKFPASLPTILLFSDRNTTSAKQADQWGSELVSEYGKDIRVVVIAVTGKGAKLVKNKVQNGFKNSDSILFDWDNEVSRQYGFVENACMVVYVNKAGTVEAVENGAYSDAKYNKLTEKLDEAEEN